MTILTKRIVWSLVALAGLIVLGTLGYIVVERQDLGDALYMTVITLTAVGYEEVWDLTTVGRGFTMFLLLAGISWLGFWFASITSLIVELDLQDALRRRRSMREIAKMEGHVIICGAGRTGRQVAQELETVTHDFVVIERDPHRIEELREYIPDVHVLEGDATHDQTLLDAGVLEAKGLITCLSADTDNLYVCLSARDLAARLTIVARAYEEESIDKLYRAGADQVISPNVSSAIRMASVLLRPSVVSFVDIATRSPDLKLRMEQTVVSEGSTVAGKTLEEARIPQETGLIVIAIGRPVESGNRLRVQPGRRYAPRRRRRRDRAGGLRSDQPSEGVHRIGVRPAHASAASRRLLDHRVDQEDHRADQRELQSRAHQTQENCQNRQQDRGEELPQNDAGNRGEGQGRKASHVVLRDRAFVGTYARGSRGVSPGVTAGTPLAATTCSGRSPDPE